MCQEIGLRLLSDIFGNGNGQDIFGTGTDYIKVETEGPGEY